MSENRQWRLYTSKFSDRASAKIRKEVQVIKHCHVPWDVSLRTGHHMRRASLRTLYWWANTYRTGMECQKIIQVANVRGSNVNLK